MVEIPDYNMGRATGEVEIKYDGRGLRQAQADMAATGTEAAALDVAMGRVNRSFDDNREKSIASAESIVKARGEVEELRKSYNRYQTEYEQGQERVNEAARRASDVLRDQRDDLNAVREAHVNLNRVEEDAERLRLRAANSYSEYRAKLESVRLEVDRFNEAHIRATSGLRNMSREAEKFGEALEGITEKLSAVARIMGQAGLFGLFGGAAAGSLFASGAGGLNILAVAMGAVVQVAEDFAGAVALIPAAVNAAVVSLGPLIVGFHGIGAALSSIGDPTKFTQAIRDLAPAAQQVMLTIQSFTSAFRGAREQIQESLFAPIIADIQPLITTWLPQLMRAGQQIANEWGQAFHQVFSFFQTPAVQQGFQTFVGNLVTGFQAARGAIQPLLTAWNTLATVGSQVFPRLGAAVTDVAEKFSAWIERTSQNGSLLEFINRALDDFTSMGHIIRDVALGLNNMFNIFNSTGQPALQTIEGLTAHFREWSQSAKGMSGITNFFNLLHIAAQAVAPQIALLGQALSIVGGTLTRLGVAIQPGLNAFFTEFARALELLAPNVIALAPAINQFLAAFGNTLLQVVQSLGPQLPQFFKTMSDAFVELLQVVPPVVDVIGKFLSKLTPGEVEALLGLIGGLKLLSATIPAVTAAMALLDIAMDANPIGLVAIAIGALVTAGVLLYENWDTVKTKVNEVTSKFGGLTGILDSLKRSWDNVTDAVARFWNNLTGQISGGWNNAISSITGFGDTLRNYFTNLWNEALQWGTNLVSNLATGIRNAIGTVLQPAIDAVASLIPDSWRTHSPAKRGPLSEMSPEEMGSRLVLQYAGGMISGRSAVDGAASDIAGSASGIGGAGGAGGTSFSTAGVSGRSGGDVSKGNSGFDQWISFITKDLTAWNNIAQEAFGLVSGVSNMVTNTLKVAASLWDRGNNPLTQPGGIFGPPLPIAQQQVPGIANKPIPGKAPLPDLVPPGPTNPQQSVPGVPNKPIPGVRGPDGPATPTPPAAPPPASVQGQAPAGQQGQLPPEAGDSPLRAALKQKGFSPEQVRLIEGFSQVEGSNPAGNPTLGFTDSQLGGDTSLQGHVDALAKQFQDRASVAGPFPQGGSDADQAGWIARVVGQSGSASDWQGNAQPKDYVNRVINAMQGVRAPAAPPPNNVQGKQPPGAQVDGGPNKLPASANANPPISNNGAPSIGLREILDRSASTGQANLDVTPFNPGPQRGQQGGTDPNFVDFGLHDSLGQNPINAPDRRGRVPGSAGDATPIIPFSAQPYGLPGNTDTGGYGSGGKGTFPQWVLDLGAQYGVTPSTYAHHQDDNYAPGVGRQEKGYAPNPENQNRGIDWVGSRENMARFANALLQYGGAEGSQGALEQVIYQAGPGGQKFGLGGAGNVAPGYYPQSGDGSYDEHGGLDTGAHVHTRFSASVPTNLQVSGFNAQPPPGAPPPAPNPTIPQSTDKPPVAQASDGDWMRVPAGWDISQPIPNDVRRQHGIPDNTPPMYYAAQPGTVQNVPAPPGSKPGQTVPTPVGPAIVSPGGTISLPSSTGTPTPGFPQTNDQRSPMDKFSQGMQAASSIAGDAFTIFSDVIQNIGAVANMSNTLVRGFENSESVVGFIQQFQSFLKTGADVAKMVGDVGGLVGMAGGADPTGGTAAAGAAVSAISGIVQSGFDTANAAISLGIDIYHEVGKYAGFFAGMFLGGPNTGPLGGNVRMLLNTKTNQMYTYSEDNPLNKNTLSVAPWQRSYTQQPNTQQALPAQVNFFAGPGQTPQQFLSDSMYAVSVSGAAVASVAGHE